MNHNSKPRLSAPECQLCQTGSAQSYATLLKAARNLSNDELKSLEDDLKYYAETGLIGIYMSRLLAQLQPEISAFAA